MNKKRPRILKKPTEKLIKVEDDLKFEANACSQNARKISSYECFHFEVWIDKHCLLRQFGGENEEARKGIGIDILEDLVSRGFRYLTAIFLENPNFKFIKFVEDRERDMRIVIKERNDDGEMLNIVVECHYIDISLYELTIITAMVIEDFRISDNQYVLQVNNENVTLKRFVSKGYQNIHELKL
jgi:hypothetical protein